MKIKYDFLFFYFLFLRDLAVCMKTKHFYFYFFDVLTTKKTGILIPDLYLYSIKIQTDIDQNTITNLRKITYFFKIIFLNFFLAGPMFQPKTNNELVTLPS